MVDSHCEVMWANNSVVGLGCHPIEDYGSAVDFPVKHIIISQHRLRSNMIGLWIKKSLTNDAKHMLSAFRTAYNFNNQYDGTAMLFFIVKMVRPDTCSGR